MTIFGVQISTRAQLVLALVSVAVIFAWAIFVLVEGRHGRRLGSALRPGRAVLHRLFYGLLYATLIFTGFETAANLAEETEDPKRSIPFAVFYSVIGVGVFYVIVMYALILAFGLDMGAFLNLENFPPLYSARQRPASATGPSARSCSGSC